MIDNARALITTLSIICLHFVFHDFYFIFAMESEDKYKTSGGNSCAVHACSNNRKKLSYGRNQCVNCTVRYMINVHVLFHANYM